MKALLKLSLVVGAAYVAQVVVECTSVTCMDAAAEGPLRDAELARLVHATPGTLVLYDLVSGDDADTRVLAERAAARLRIEPSPAAPADDDADHGDGATSPLTECSENEPAASAHLVADATDAAGVCH